jgi:putative sterol carrier protein
MVKKGTTMLEDILNHLLSVCEADLVLHEFAQKRSVSVNFIITDQNVEFQIAFVDGQVRTSRESPLSQSDLVVKLDAKTFDEVMSGKSDGSLAYMTGQIRISGDLMRAMSMQKIIRDMVRLYTRVKRELGSPGGQA